MIYTELFRQMRETKNLTHEQLARKAGCHRNTVINVESGRPVKFRTIAKLMKALHATEVQLQSMALLWVEATSGLELRGNKEATEAVNKITEPEDKALAALRTAAKKLPIDEIIVLTWAAQNCGARQILKGLKDPTSLKC